MQQERHEFEASTSIDWICAALAVSAFFAYILVIAYSPELFRRPVAPGTLVSVGIVCGVALTVFLVALAGIYSHLRNRFPRQ